MSAVEQMIKKEQLLGVPALLPCTEFLPPSSSASTYICILVPLPFDTFCGTGARFTQEMEVEQQPPALSPPIFPSSIFLSLIKEILIVTCLNMHA